MYTHTYTYIHTYTHTHQVDRIIDEDRPVKKFLVKWKGLGYEHATWERARDLQDSVEHIDRYKAYIERYKSKPDAEKRPVRKGQQKATDTEGTCALLTKQPTYLRGGKLFEYQVYI
jgi:hypothetical protein